MIGTMFHLAALGNFLEKTLDAVRRRPNWTLTFAVFCLVAAGWQASRLKLELDLYGKDVQGFKSTHDFREQRHRFKDTNGALFIFSPSTGTFSNRNVCTIKEWLDSELRSNSEVSEVTSAFALRQAVREDDKIWYPLYFVPPCESDSTAKLGAPADFRKLLETPWKDSLTDSKGRDFAVEIVFRDTPGGSRFGTFDPEPIKLLHLKAERELRTKIPNLNVYLGGASAFESHLKDAMMKDIWLQGLVFIFIILAFRFCFGTWRAGIVFLGTLVITLTFVYGLMGLCGVALDLLTTNLVLMTTLAGLEDFLFVSMLMRTGRSRNESLRAMVMPCLFTTLTTAIGFLSLQTSDVAIIGRFGVWAAWGAFAEWIVMFYILPAACDAWPALGNWVDPRRLSKLGWISRVSNLRVSRSAFKLSFVLFALGGVSFWFLNLNETPTQNFPKDHLTTRTHEYLKESRGWEAAVYLVFEMPNLRDQRDRVQNTIAKLRLKDHVTSIVDPFSIEKFVAARLPSSDHQLIASDLQLTGPYRRVFSGRDVARAVVYLDRSDLETLEKFTAQVREICPDDSCRVSGHSAVYLEYSRKIVPTLLESFGMSLVLVSLILYGLAYALKVRQRFAVIYSAIWGPVAMLGVIALFQIPVSLMTSLFAATIVGLTGDNGIQFLFASKNGELQVGMDARGEGSVLLSFLLAGASLVFLAETVKPMQILGVLFFIGFIMNLVGDLWLLKGAIHPTTKN